MHLENYRYKNITARYKLLKNDKLLIRTPVTKCTGISCTDSTKAKQREGNGDR